MVAHCYIRSPNKLNVQDLEISSMPNSGCFLYGLSELAYPEYNDIAALEDVNF